MGDKFSVTALLTTVCVENPALRVGQILYIAASKGGWRDADLFYCPDSMLLKGLKLMANGDVTTSIPVAESEGF